jgi:hypothetical protein
MLTTQQIKWAKRHDWYEATLPNGKILANDYDTDGLRAQIIFDDFKELYNWAGY